MDIKELARFSPEAAATRNMLARALEDWKDAGGSVEDVLNALDNYNQHHSAMQVFTHRINTDRNTEKTGRTIHFR